MRSRVKHLVMSVCVLIIVDFVVVKLKKIITINNMCSVRLGYTQNQLL